MTKVIRMFSVLVVSSFVVLAFGCSTSSTPPASEPEAHVPPAPGPDLSSAEPDPAVQVSVALEPVYFDTDRAILRPEARAALKSTAKSIVAHPEWGVVRIHGHCDERGSVEYNLALGERRAAAVERYLVEMGVPDTRLTTESFGSRRPAVRGHDETAWRYNRRSELTMGDTLASTSR